MSGQLKILLYICLVVGILYFLQSKYSLFEISFNNPNQGKEKLEKESEINSLEILNSEGQKIYVELEIADTVESRKQGLSDRRELGDYQGMLFIFDTEGGYSFWMKDMYLPLDLIYIDGTSYIVDIIEDVQPCPETECVSFIPSVPFKYVLEVNGGFAKLNRVNIGNAVIFDISSEE